MGGISTDIAGRSSVKGIYAAGEVARTGVHGANRLASNSLLEGLVFGKRAGESAISEYSEENIKEFKFTNKMKNREKIAGIKILEMRSELKKIMWENVGILRDERRLKSAFEKINEISIKLAGYSFGKDSIVKGVELINMLTVASLITESALLRKESRGAHYRLDYPEASNGWLIHTIIKK